MIKGLKFAGIPTRDQTKAIAREHRPPGERRDRTTAVDAIPETDQLAALGQFTQRAQNLPFTAEVEKLTREKGIVAASGNPPLNPLPQCHPTSRHGTLHGSQKPDSNICKAC